MSTDNEILSDLQIQILREHIEDVTEIDDIKDILADLLDAIGEILKIVNPQSKKEPDTE